MISFNAIRNLPIILPTTIPNDEQCYETEFAGTKIIVTHVYQVVYGAVYDASFSGKQETIEFMLEAMSAEFGPCIGEFSGSGVHYLWASGCLEIPQTYVHKVLSQEQIPRICRKYELSQEDKMLLQDILAHFTTLLGQTEKQECYLRATIGHLPQGQRANITQALLEIIVDFNKATAKQGTN